MAAYSRRSYQGFGPSVMPSGCLTPVGGLHADGFRGDTGGVDGVSSSVFVTAFAAVFVRRDAFGIKSQNHPVFDAK